MNCPTCQAALPEDAAFCGHCGGALRSERTCARCGRHNSSEMRFCLGCGAALSPASPAQAPRTYTPKHLADRILAEQAAMEARGAQDGERKTITALFADIKSSVEMMETADRGCRSRRRPPHRRSCAPAHDRCSAPLRGLRRAVDRRRHLRPVRCPDRVRGPSAARAICAALRMQDELRRYAGKLPEQGRGPLRPGSLSLEERAETEVSFRVGLPASFRGVSAHDEGCRLRFDPALV
jgi:double zinc ribbon protein